MINYVIDSLFHYHPEGIRFRRTRFLFKLLGADDWSTAGDVFNTAPPGGLEELQIGL